MRVKPKLNEVIFFYNELQLLKKRLEFGTDQVKNFFIINFGPIDLQLKNKNVTIINGVIDLEDFFSFENHNSFTQILISHDVSIEDIIIFSKVFEIPDYEKITSESNLCKNKPVVLRQTPLFWNHFYTSDTPHYGTKMITMSFFLRQPQIILDMLDLNYPIFLNYEVIEGGYSIQGFERFDKFCESFIYWNKIKSEKSTVSKKLLLSKNELKEFWLKKHRKKIYKKKSIKLPKIFRFSTNTIVEVPKKILIKNSYQFVPEINFDLILHLKQNEIEIQGQTKYKLFFPKAEMYESKIDFIGEFGKNEILFVLKNLELQDYDQIHIIKKTDELPSVFTYKKFKTLIPSEVF